MEPISKTSTTGTTSVLPNETFSSPLQFSPPGTIECEATYILAEFIVQDVVLDCEDLENLNFDFDRNYNYP
jgi:hypothetical protein